MYCLVLFLHKMSNVLWNPIKIFLNDMHCLCALMYRLCKILNAYDFHTIWALHMLLFSLDLTVTFYINLLLLGKKTYNVVCVSVCVRCILFCVCFCETLAAVTTSVCQSWPKYDTNMHLFRVASAANTLGEWEGEEVKCTQSTNPICSFSSYPSFISNLWTLNNKRIRL